jgi:hypothetical protein
MWGMERVPSGSPLSRIFDLIAVGAVAIVLLLPSGSLSAKPALVGDKIELDRVAQLEDARFAEPDDVQHALDLADAYLHLEHPDWALATTAAFVTRGDHRVHLARALAYADRWQPQASLAETGKAFSACDAEGEQRCDVSQRVRINIVAAPMQALVDAKIDPRKDPKRAREAVAGVLHATKAKDFSTPAVKPAKK